MNIKGVIFDFNGVIVDDYKIQKHAWDYISSKLRGKMLTDTEWVNARGRRAEDFIKDLTKGKFNDKQLERLNQKREAIVKSAYVKNPTSIFFSGIKTFFNNLKKQGFPMTIATSCNIRMIGFYFNRLDLSRWFKFENIIYNDNKHPGKPAPDVYLLAIKQLALKPSECVVFEDAESGIISAYKADVRKIIAVGIEESLVELRKLPGVSKTIHDFSEIEVSNIFK